MDAKFEDLKGKVLIQIIGDIGSEEMIFTTDTGKSFCLYHDQDCCESVDIADIVGDLDDLIGSEILMAEEVISEQKNPEGVEVSEKCQDSFTWTFYKLATVKGYVDIRWYGSSNGHYSESVKFKHVTD